MSLVDSPLPNDLCSNPHVRCNHYTHLALFSHSLLDQEIIIILEATPQMSTKFGKHSELYASA
jgi:hypothetical protein